MEVKPRLEPTKRTTDLTGCLATGPPPRKETDAGSGNDGTRNADEARAHPVRCGYSDGGHGDRRGDAVANAVADCRGGHRRNAEGCDGGGARAGCAESASSAWAGGGAKRAVSTHRDAKSTRDPVIHHRHTEATNAAVSTQADADTDAGIDADAEAPVDAEASIAATEAPSEAAAPVAVAAGLGRDGAGKRKDGGEDREDVSHGFSLFGS
jgi:hypothetical protein